MKELVPKPLQASAPLGVQQSINLRIAEKGIRVAETLLVALNNHVERREPQFEEDDCLDAIRNAQRLRLLMLLGRNSKRPALGLLKLLLQNLCTYPGEKDRPEIPRQPFRRRGADS